MDLVGHRFVEDEDKSPGRSDRGSSPELHLDLELVSRHLFMHSWPKALFGQMQPQKKWYQRRFELD